MLYKAKLALVVSCFFGVGVSLHCMQVTSMSEQGIELQTILFHKAYPDKLNSPSKKFYEFSCNSQLYIANMRYFGRMVIRFAGQITDQSSILYHADNIVSFFLESTLSGQYFAEKCAFFVFTHASSKNSFRLIRVIFDRASQLFYVDLSCADREIKSNDSFSGSWVFHGEQELTNDFLVVVNAGTSSNFFVQIEQAVDGRLGEFFSENHQRPVLLCAQIDPKKACAKVQKNFINNFESDVKLLF